MAPRLCFFCLAAAVHDLLAGVLLDRSTTTCLAAYTGMVEQRLENQDRDIDQASSSSASSSSRTASRHHRPAATGCLFDRTCGGTRFSALSEHDSDEDNSTNQCSSDSLPRGPEQRSAEGEDARSQQETSSKVKNSSEKENKDEEQMSQKLHCAICMLDQDEEDQKEAWITLPSCGHTFHLACVRRVALVGEEGQLLPTAMNFQQAAKIRRCPMCREAISPEDCADIADWVNEQHELKAESEKQLAELRKSLQGKKAARRNGGSSRLSSKKSRTTGRSSERTTSGTPREDVADQRQLQVQFRAEDENSENQQTSHDHEFIPYRHISDVAASASQRHAPPPPTQQDSINNMPTTSLLASRFAARDGENQHHRRNYNFYPLGSQGSGSTSLSFPLNLSRGTTGGTSIGGGATRAGSSGASLTASGRNLMEKSSGSLCSRGSSGEDSQLEQELAQLQDRNADLRAKHYRRPPWYSLAGIKRWVLHRCFGRQRQVEHDLATAAAAQQRTMTRDEYYGQMGAFDASFQRAQDRAAEYDRNRQRELEARNNCWSDFWPEYDDRFSCLENGIIRFFTVLITIFKHPHYILLALFLLAGFNMQKMGPEYVWESECILAVADDLHRAVLENSYYTRTGYHFKTSSGGGADGASASAALTQPSIMPNDFLLTETDLAERFARIGEEIVEQATSSDHSSTSGVGTPFSRSSTATSGEDSEDISMIPAEVLEDAFAAWTLSKLTPDVTENRFGHSRTWFMRKYSELKALANSCEQTGVVVEDEVNVARPRFNNPLCAEKERWIKEVQNIPMLTKLEFYQLLQSFLAEEAKREEELQRQGWRVVESTSENDRPSTAAASSSENGGWRVVEPAALPIDDKKLQGTDSPRPVSDSAAASNDLKTSSESTALSDKMQEVSQFGAVARRLRGFLHGGVSFLHGRHEQELRKFGSSKYLLTASDLYRAIAHLPRVKREILRRCPVVLEDRKKSKSSKAAGRQEEEVLQGDDHGREQAEVVDQDEAPQENTWNEGPSPEITLESAEHYAEMTMRREERSTQKSQLENVPDLLRKARLQG
ncbi:unnamed protein product [Amoebophrya sp. A120]|nr:unnamed protein product [Amoebophrya sp. A120]|eukprot:GSA120T00007765001.1